MDHSLMGSGFAKHIPELTPESEAFGFKSPPLEKMTKKPGGTVDYTRTHGDITQITVHSNKNGETYRITPNPGGAYGVQAVNSRGDMRKSPVTRQEIEDISNIVRATLGNKVSPEGDSILAGLAKASDQAMFFDDCHSAPPHLNRSPTFHPAAVPGFPE